MSGHHLILGKLADFLTGEVLADTLDERYRQKIARLLVERKEYRPQEIAPRHELVLQAGDRRAIITVDWLVKITGRTDMIIRFAPGSLVSRERPTLAISRLVEPYQVPVAVVTNGEDAEIMDASSGRIIAQGLEAVPSKSELRQRVQNYSYPPVPPERAAVESRIAYCYEVDDACPCDDTICRLP